MKKNKIKILHFTNNLPNVHQNFGGAEKACQNIAELVSDKTKNIIVTTKFDQKPTLKNIKVIEVKTLPDFFPKKIGGFLKELKLQLFPFDFLAMSQIKKIVKKEKPQVIHLHNFYFFSFGIIGLAKKLGIKVIFSIYDYWLFCPVGMFWKQNKTICQKPSFSSCAKCVAGYRFSQRSFFKFLLFFLFVWRDFIFNRYLTKIDKFICLSKSSVEILAKNRIAPEKIELIFLPIDKKELFSISQVKKIENTLLYVGWIQPRKGLLKVVEALSLVDKKLKITLKVIGLEYDQSYTKLIKKKIAQNKLEVSFLGNTPRQQTKEWIHRAEAVVLPEQWPNMSPVFLLESLMAGKIIFAANIGGIGGFIKNGENGFLFKSSSSQDLANKINFYFKNKKKLFPKISKNAFRFAQKNLSPQAVEGQYLKLYTDLTKK